MFRPLGLIFPVLSLAIFAMVILSFLVPALSPFAIAAIGVAVIVFGSAILRIRPLHVDLAILGLVVVLALAVGSATPAAADTVVSAGPAYDFFQPYLQALADAAIVALIGWTARLVQRWTGIQIEARHREALHSAAMTGVTQALAQLGVRLDHVTADVHSEIVAQAISWIEASVPDAIKALGVSPDKVSMLASAKLGQLIAGAQSSLPIVNIENIASVPQAPPGAGLYDAPAGAQA